MGDGIDDVLACSLATSEPQPPCAVDAEAVRTVMDAVRRAESMLISGVMRGKLIVVAEILEEPPVDQ